jgi:DNA polymerase V
LTDFWRVGKGYARKLAECGLYTMGDIARCSLGKPTDYYNEDLLYRLFGVNAELLIDHAWGWEPCTMAEIKAYRPENNSICSGQVLQCPYPYDKGLLVVREMADQLALDLVDKGLVTDQLVLTVGYDIENLTDPVLRKQYTGPVTTDAYGRKVPKHAHGTANLKQPTASSMVLMETVTELYERIMDPQLLIRRFSLTANHVKEEKCVVQEETYEQLDLFTDYEQLREERRREADSREKEKRIQKAMLDVRKKYGKNAMLKGMNLKEGATARDRNGRIGGHKA